MMGRFPFLCIVWIDIVNIVTLPKAMNRFNTILFKIQTEFFTKIEMQFKLYMETNKQTKARKQNS